MQNTSIAQRRGLSVLCAACVLWSATAALAQNARTTSDEREFSGLSWGGALYLDVLLPATFWIMAETEGTPFSEDGNVEGPLDVLGGPIVITAGLGTAFGFGYLMGEVLEVPGDVAFVAHTALLGGVNGLLLGCGALGSDGCTDNLGIQAFALSMATMTGAYAVHRLDAFRQDPDRAAAYAFIPAGGIAAGVLLGGAVFGIIALDSGEAFNTDGLLLAMAAGQLLSFAITTPIIEAGFQDATLSLLPGPNGPLLSLSGSF